MATTPRQKNKNTNGSSSHSYNLKAVVQETGLKPDTLRAWERRYGLPVPERTDGGHRLYSQRDIDTLKWLSARQDDGLSISRAVDLWHQYVSDGKDPLKEVPVVSDTPTKAVVPTGANLEKMQQAWVDACMDFDEVVARQIISQALAMYTPEVVCLAILQKGMAAIGMGWAEGTITAQQEHFASALAMRRLEALVASTAPPTREGRILIGCAPEEEHSFASLLLTFFMRRRGWETLYLGANVPIERLEATVRAAEPSLVVMTAQSLHTASLLFGMAEVLAKEDVPLAFGGLVFSMIESLHEYIPGHFLGSKLEDAHLAIEQHVAMPSDPDPVRVASAKYVAAHGHFLDRQAMIEAVVWDKMAPFDVRPDHLARANRDLSRNIIAALLLGSIDLLGDNFDWVNGMLMNAHYRLPDGFLERFMDAFLTACQQTLDQRGDVLIDWLQKIVDSA